MRIIQERDEEGKEIKFYVDDQFNRQANGVIIRLALYTMCIPIRTEFKSATSLKFSLHNGK